MNRHALLMSSLAAAILAVGSLPDARAADNSPAPKAEFGRTTIDLGVVVSNLDKAVKFYTDAIGFTEVQGFSVPGDFCADAGLTSGKPLSIRVLVLGEGESATKIKLMEVPGVETKKTDNAFIHSQFGFRYLTISVTDTNAAVARLKKAGVSPIAKCPVALPKGLPQGVYLTVVRDPDGNLVELLGPKK
jgi:catechol 2,3-dioxygenase-like lactoylglutathione lyase family enzyme